MDGHYWEDRMNRMRRIFLTWVWFWSVGILGGVEFRARVLEVGPVQPCRVHWRWGGEGLGGRVVSGELTRFLPDAEVVGEVVEEGRTFNYGYLAPGSWSRWEPLAELKAKGRRLFVTFTLEGHKDGRNLAGGKMEFEFREGGKLLRKFSVNGPDGPTFGVVVPLQHVEDGLAFAVEVGSLHDYARRKVEVLSEAPWAKLPTPKLYGIVTDCAGYQPGSGYGCRTTDKATMLEEFKVLKLLGINGTRSLPDFVLEEIKSGTGIGPDFSRARITHTSGYPISMVKRSDGKAPRRSPGDGCPNHPVNVMGVPERVEAAVASLKKEVGELPEGELWALTVDEIGSVFDGSPEGKAHQGACPFCQEDFRKFVQADGLTLEDFGAEDWSQIRSTYGYWETSFWDRKAELEKVVSDARKRMDAEVVAAFDLDKENEAEDSILLELELEEGKPSKSKGKASPKALAEAEKNLRDFIWTGKVAGGKAQPKEHGLSGSGWNLLHYYSRKYNGEASARLFQPLQEAVAATGENVYSYALRGNTFLMGGHSLGFFDFYKYADNGFVYETSNRDPRVWQWDSYLCDVGRSLQKFRGKRFAVYVKPHRGAPVQRALTAVARGAKMIYWYTYGPDWNKGDTFGGKLEVLDKIGWVNRLIGQAEDVIYDSEWAVPAEVAIVRPRTAEFLSGNASWENGKWVHTALMHANIPVDALDEDLLIELDLKSYKAIVVCGDHIRRDVAEKLKEWVKAGGHLMAYGNGMSRDESGQPLEMLWDMFGVSKREASEIWGKVSKYGATKLKPVEPVRTAPGGADVYVPSMGRFSTAVGREVLFPSRDAEAVVEFMDKGAMIVRNSFGEGTAWLNGTYAGLEYSVEAMEGKPANPLKLELVARPLELAGVWPVVSSSEPLVEGILLKNRKTGKRAVVLMNWEFNSPDGVELELKGTGPAQKFRSLALGKDFKVNAEGDVQKCFLPSLAEGDILLLD